ncbi:MOSC domain-containing protein [Amaricoccus solimangrovi]|uniref:MOSC domain-containing protein n=1 Tax=Amaricoccus solimangrovi TaxID=2589815 RepID=A0A501WT40_9RHOB|nr:MOSC N-terminal beta barrel domain-containing protein [Amaricoccus solimangrovi]TPE50457.1 MOSC domain-containing protein [Amaricoccus solimangrovi]
MARVSHLWRHPIKGHGAEAVRETRLAPSETMPWDRVWAIAHDAARITPGATGWMPCANFARGARTPALMAIRARMDEEAGTVTLTHPRMPELTVDPDLPEDAERLVAWARGLAEEGRVAPAFVVRPTRGMTDSGFPSIAILNRASLAALSERAGQPLAMERFRGNVWLDGLEPWAEFDLVGREIRIGESLLLVRERITRCRATGASPETGRIDVDTLGLLQSGWGHRDFGVYAEVVEGGRVALGDPAEVMA